MAKALTRPRGRRHRTSDRHERELKRLRLSICDDAGFRLYLATYDQPKRRDELITRVIRDAEADKVRVTRLDLGEAKPDTNLVGLLRAHLQEQEVPPGWRQAVMVTGIEQRLEYAHGREGYAFLHQANLLRDALPEAVPLPVVLWLSRLASAALPAQAPDPWHWRAANFDFTGDEAPRLELLRELTTPRTEDDFGLSGEQRQARIQMLEDLLAELEREGPPTSKRQKSERADLLLQLGIEDWRLGHAAEAIPRFARALEIARENGDRQREGVGLGGLGDAYATLGERRQAIEQYEQALKIFREIGDRKNEGLALGKLGNAYWQPGELRRRSIAHFEQALEIFREIGDRRAEGAALGNLGNAYLLLSEPRRAIAFYEQQLAIAHENGDQRGEGQALGGLGNAYAELGELRRAIEQYEEALAIARESGDRQSEGRTLANLGSAYYSLGEPRRALEHYEQALAIARETGNQRSEGNMLFSGAVMLDQLGERSRAMTRMEEALRIYERIESPWQENARAQLAEWRGEGSG